MKKLVIIIVLSIIPLLFFAQNSCKATVYLQGRTVEGAISYVFDKSQSEHMLFKGIPIDGPVDEFVSKLEEAGFTYILRNDEKVVLEGTFAGFSHCEISVFFTDNNVWSVVVSLPLSKNWESAKSRYNDLKASFKDKYKVSPRCTEKANESKSDAEIVRQFKEDRATWQSLYKLPLGAIVLWIDSSPLSFLVPSFTVYICYRDDANYEASMKSAYDDL